MPRRSGDAAKAGCPHRENFTALRPLRVAEPATFSRDSLESPSVIVAVSVGISVAFTRACLETSGLSTYSGALILSRAFTSVSRPMSGRACPTTTMVAVHIRHRDARGAPCRHRVRRRTHRPPPPTPAPAVLRRTANLPLIRGSLQTNFRYLTQGSRGSTLWQTNKPKLQIHFQSINHGVKPSLHPA